MNYKQQVLSWHWKTEYCRRHGGTQDDPDLWQLAEQAYQQKLRKEQPTTQEN